jgi:hypothetical protein
MTSRPEPVARSAATVAREITNRLRAERADQLVEALRRGFVVDAATVVIVDADRRHVAIAGRRFAVERRRRGGEVVCSLRELDGDGRGSWRLARADSPTKLVALLRASEPAPVSPLREVAAAGGVIAWLAVPLGVLFAAEGHSGSPRIMLYVVAAVVAAGGAMLAHRFKWLRARRLDAGSDDQTVRAVT